MNNLYDLKNIEHLNHEKNLVIAIIGFNVINHFILMVLFILEPDFWLSLVFLSISFLPLFIVIDNIRAYLNLVKIVNQIVAYNFMADIILGLDE